MVLPFAKIMYINYLEHPSADYIPYISGFPFDFTSLCTDSSSTCKSSYT